MPLGALIGAGASLAGGLISAVSNRAAGRRNEAMQRDAAQNSVQWRVADARKAGVSPLVALGMSPISMSPAHVGDTGLPNALQSMGQDVSRAVAATSGPQAKFDAALRALTLEKAGLENQLLASQIRKMNAPGMVSAPGEATVLPGQGDLPVVELNAPQRTPYWVDVNGNRVMTGPSSDAQTFEDRYGEIGGEIAGIGNVFNDLVVLPLRRHFRSQRVNRRINRSYWD